MLRWRESGRAPPLTLPTEARRRRRRVEPPRILSPPWRRKREKLLGSPFPKHPHLCKLIFLRHCLFICLAPVLMHFARFRKKATTSLKKTSKLGASRTIKDMLHRDTSPAIAPTTPSVKPSSAPASSQAKEASSSSAMEVDSGASTEVAVVGEQATQESAAHQMAEAPAKDAIGSGKAVASR